MISYRSERHATDIRVEAINGVHSQTHKEVKTIRIVLTSSEGVTDLVFDSLGDASAFAAGFLSVLSMRLKEQVSPITLLPNRMPVS